MSDPARHFFDTLLRYSDLDALLANGETEGLYLECKSPGGPQVSRELRVHLAKALSGFSNTAGGVVIWGISTTKHEHGGLDVLTQIESIANARHFSAQLQKVIPTLTTPPVTACETRVITKSPSDTRGVIATYVPHHAGDPLQSNADEHFYFRSGDEFTVAPFEMVKRLFAATDTPDLHPIFAPKLIALQPDGTWKLPIVLENRSSAIAEHVLVSIEFENSSACESITSSHFKDASGNNPGKTIFMHQYDKVIHRGVNTVIGDFRLKMKVVTRAKRKLNLNMRVLANRMRGRYIILTLSLAKSGFRIVDERTHFLY